MAAAFQQRGSRAGCFRGNNRGGVPRHHPASTNRAGCRTAISVRFPLKRRTGASLRRRPPPLRGCQGADACGLTTPARVRPDPLSRAAKAPTSGCQAVCRRGSRLRVYRGYGLRHAPVHAALKPLRTRPAEAAGGIFATFGWPRLIEPHAAKATAPNRVALLPGSNASQYAVTR